MTGYAIGLQNGTDTAPRVRGGAAALRFPNGAVRARGGLRPDGGGAVTVSAGTMNVNVAPLSGWVDTALPGQGGFPFVLDASVALAIDPGDASLVRIDVIAVVVRETAFDSGGVTTAAVEVIKGAPGAGAPALPAASIPLRNISVHAGASTGSGGLTNANLSTDRRQWSVAAGGILPVASATERDALTPVEGMAVYRQDTDKVEVWRSTGGGGEWLTQARAADLPQAGTAAITITAATHAGVTVTFPYPYAVAPVVVANIGGYTADSTRRFFNCVVDQITPTTALIRAAYIPNTNTTITLPIQWIALPAS